jgi:phenylacetate-CoA ligase
MHGQAPLESLLVAGGERKMDGQDCWNPILEMLPPEKLYDLQLRKFKRILGWTYEHSPFYRKVYREVGFEPGDVRTFDDIHLVPNEV